MKQIYKVDETHVELYGINDRAREKAEVAKVWRDNDIRSYLYRMMKQGEKYFLFWVGNYDGDEWVGVEVDAKKAKELIEEADYDRVGVFLRNEKMVI